jgi:hypothetical protein
VPTQGEWYKLLVTWATEKNVALTERSVAVNMGYKYFTDNKYAPLFANEFLLPLAGRRTHSSGELTLTGTRGYFLSSSPISDYDSYLEIDSSSVFADTHSYRTWGYPVRCFKNTFVPILPPIEGSLTYDPSTPTSGTITATLQLTQTGTVLSEGRTPVDVDEIPPTPLYERGWYKVYT